MDYPLLLPASYLKSAGFVPPKPIGIPIQACYGGITKPVMGT
jgi:hypothetical protein